MEAEVLQSIQGIGVFPAVSLILFVVVFTVMLVWTARLDRARLEELSGLPLDAPAARGARPRLGAGADGGTRQ